MPNILTPVTLWRDFDEKLPLGTEIVSETVSDGVVCRDLYFYGRKTQQGRVKIYARYVFPAGEDEFPAVMILFEAGFRFDEKLVRMFTENGYGVLCVDYCGGGEGLTTVYPADVEYATYRNAETALDRCERTAKETCWYEWACVARYAAKFLNTQKEVSLFGALGLRTGGEVLFKIAPYAPLSCMISVCAAGWLAYRGIDKFSEASGKQIFDDERHRFIAGIDSQSYAPFVKCPVLLLSAINDKKYNYDRVYDTFRQINPEVEKAILFSSHGNGLIGTHSMTDLMLFLDKYLRDRSVFLPKPISVTAGEDEDGNLIINGTFDAAGEIKEYGIFYSENLTAFKARDWTRVFGKDEDLDGNVGSVPLGLYANSSRALVYAFVNYSNNFSVTSKILEVNVTKQYRNIKPHSRVIYSSQDERNGFSSFRRRTKSIADCFIDGVASDVQLLSGYGGIKGVTAPSGIISYRVGEPRYEPPEGVSFHFDAYAKTDVRLRVAFYTDDEERIGFYAETFVEGGGKWKSIVLDADDFKAETGASLPDFSEVVSVVFTSDEEVLINNVLWI